MKELKIFNLLALKGTSKILLALLSKQEMTFSQLVELVGQPSTTNRALKQLLKFRLISRRVLDLRFRPVAYSLTSDGRRLAEIVALLLDFERELNLKLESSRAHSSSLNSSVL